MGLLTHSVSAGDRRPLVILGASGHGREVAEAVRQGIIHPPEIFGGLEGFLDDDPDLYGSIFGGTPVVGTLDWERLSECHAALGVGYPETKQRLIRRLRVTPRRWPWIAHRASTIGSDSSIESGVLVQAGVVITTGVRVGRFATVNLGATISHDTVVGELATVSPGASIGGNVTIGEGAFIGIGASVIQGVTIGAWSVVGAGAVVIEDVEPNTVVAGVPARVINRREPGWQND